MRKRWWSFFTFFVFQEFSQIVKWFLQILLKIETTLLSRLDNEVVIIQSVTRNAYNFGGLFKSQLFLAFIMNFPPLGYFLKNLLQSFSSEFLRDKRLNLNLNDLIRNKQIFELNWLLKRRLAKRNKFFNFIIKNENFLFLFAEN